MKALRILKPGETAIEEIPVPEFGSHDVLVRITTVGFCGSDLATFRGANPLVTYPRIPGHELSGVIAAVGSGVSGAWRVGMPVLASPYTNCGKCSACRRKRFNCCRFNQTLGVQRDGAMTELLAVPQGKLFTSATLSPDAMASVEPLTVGFHAVDRGGVQATDRVVVFGCGAIGLGAIAGAACRDATVVAVDIDDAKLALARKAGARYAVNSATGDLHEALRELTDGEGPEVLIEAVGLPQTYRFAVEEACFAGRIVYIGYAKAPVAYETKFFVQKELDIRGSRNATPADFRAVMAMLEDGRFPLGDVLTRTVPLDEAGEALAEWDADPATVTKIHVRIGG